uniref:Integrase core domain containing protein n=1 Tax=Solanum tuberosum TaxID=4113 RepID=M1DE40_SOLTU
MKLVLQCPTHGLPNNVLLQYFYRSIDLVNKGLADQLVRGGIMLQSFQMTLFLLDNMTKINQALYTQEDQVSPLCFGITQEQLDKEKERDENINKMLSQMELLQTQMLENATRPKGPGGMFRVDEGSSSSYSKSGENQGWNSNRYEEGFHPRYLQRGGNQCWNFHKEEEIGRYYQEWADQSDSWRREDDHEEDHTLSSESPKSKGSANSPRVDDLLSRILNKVDGLDDLLKGMKVDFSSLNNRVNSHTDAIRLLEGQLSLLSAKLEPNIIWENGDRGLAVVTRSGKVAVGDIKGNDESQAHEEDKGIEEE